MKGKFHLATVRPRVDITGNVAYTQHDMLFDWHRFEIPKGGCCIKSFNMIVAGTDGAGAAGLNMDLWFARSVNGVAPPSIANTNSDARVKATWTQCRTHIIAHKLLDATAMENAVTYTLSYHVWDQTAVGDQLHNQLQPGGIMLEGDPNYTGTTPGYQSVWIAAISTEGGEDFNTGGLIDGAQAAVSKTPTSSVALVTTGTDANIVFAVGDEVMAFDEDGSGPAKVGIVTAVSANLLTVDRVEEAIGDDDELLLRAPFTFNFGLEY